MGDTMQGYESGLREEEKERIIRELLPFIKYTAARMSWRLPTQLTVDDLVSAGLVGLMEALRKFEPGRVKLKTFAEFRIRGSMLDELRAVEWVPRSLKKKIHVLKGAHRRLENELGRAPEGEEVAAALSMSLDEYYATLTEANAAVTVRFEDFESEGSSDEGMNILECLPDPNAGNPLMALEVSAQKEKLARFVGALPEKEKLILSLYYWDEMTMKEIGEVMKLTEGRICQLHAQALIRLRAKLDSESKEFFQGYR